MEVKASTIKAAREFIESSINAVKLIGLIGSRILRDGDVVLTHCNSSAALSVLKHAKVQGKNIRVIATETRPRFQGYVTYKALLNMGIKATLIPDSAVRFFIKDVDRVIVGADTVTANGAVVNKVGTSLIALAAHEARVRVFVVASTLKFSPETIFGELVKLMLRPIKRLPERIPVELSEVPAAEFPLFDVTPPEYIDAIITERGVVAPEAVILLVRDIYGWPPRLKKIADITSELKAMVQGGVK